MNSQTSVMRWLLISFAVIFVCSMCGKGVISAQAHDRLDVVTRYVDNEKIAIDKLNDELKRVQKDHLSLYVKDINFTKADSEIKELLALCKKAKSEHHPNAIHALCKEGEGRLKSLIESLSEYNGYFIELDAAKAGYQTASADLKKERNNTSQYIKSLVGEGYFARHFQAAEQFMGKAAELQIRVDMLGSQKIEREMPDYLAIFRSSKEGIHIARQAYAMAQAVPDGRKRTEEQVKRIKQSTDDVRRKYDRALVASRELERYPRYRRLDGVIERVTRLSEVSPMIAEASRKNDMQAQDFAGAAEIIGNVQRTLDQLASYFDETVAVMNRIRLAVAAIPDARKDATGAINRAASHIRSYSENSQSQAESYLAEARRYFSSGDNNRYSDPPISLKAFQDAEEQAKKARNAVDTSDHSSSSVTWGSDDGGSSGSFGGFGGGSSSDYGGGSSTGDSYGGGGFDSSPSSGSSYGGGGL
jgi:hypothetical protein